MDRVEDSPQERGEFLEGFTLLLGFTEACGICLIILVTIWTSYYRDGFSWRSDPKLEFNWHPLLMIIGLVYLYGNGKHLKMIFSHKKFFHLCI
jgi:cytochrome b-561